MFIFDGGVLSAAETATIQLCPNELEGFSFFAPDALPTQ
jgi:hypothetical protein